ncbi:helix-turn-helix domain-containing protein [Kitasatospora sp. NPDC101183]|uniref:helix-turn-helix domain-containing protein n=1 Tax=Kitasatospora sp. NPDC101183 TaxID=3364100 RepID=UPI0037FAC08B
MDSSQQRRCTSCGSTLSRYNAGAKCGPCQRDLRIAPEFWDDPQVQQAVATWDLGTLCRLVRRHTGLPQAAFARIVNSDQSEISRLERGQRTVKDRRKMIQWAQVLNFPEELAGPLPSELEDGESTTYVAQPPSLAIAAVGPRCLRFPAGQSLPGANLPALVIDADTFYGNELHLSGSAELDAWVKAPTRSLVIAKRTIDGASRQFAVDARFAGRAQDRPLRISSAYELDDLTYGILWAVTGFDAALLSDDAGLHTVLPLTTDTDLDPLASAVRDEELAAGSLMFIGSQASAHYILDNRDALGEAPLFWTRERTGEEAATWLFFSHKLDYLRRTAPATPEARSGTGRAFCIPPEAVTRSPGYERVMLFLVIALMESHGITTWITESPDLAETEGFVLIPQQRAVIASWVRAEAVSKLGRTTRRADLRTFADAVGHAAVHSATAADAAHGRLIATADYLGLDWPWLTRRCRQLASVGTRALARPRSRLLGLEGLDAACQFIAAHHVP